MAYAYLGPDDRAYRINRGAVDYRTGGTPVFIPPSLPRDRATRSAMTFPPYHDSGQLPSWSL